jgi:hypothetical protein
LRTHVYNNICRHIDTMVPDIARRTALFLIFSELLQGNELGLDYLTKRYGTLTKDSIGRSTIQRLLRQLRDDDLIKVDIYGHRTTHHAHHYTLTLAGHDLVKTSSKAFWTYGDYQRNRGSINAGDRALAGNYHIPEHEHYASWLRMLAPSKDTDRFISGLVQLESHELVFRRYEALQNPAMIRRLFQLRNIPKTSFNVKYRPLRSGRQQSVPHTYIGKELVHNIRPANDPHLTKGILFSLDYSSQELRILASLLSADSPINQWAQNPDNHFSELLAIYDIKMPQHLWKGFMYSFLYGSQGEALADAMNYEEAVQMGEFSRRSAARSIVSDFTKKVPEIVSLRDHFSEIFVRDCEITAPGGFTRMVDPGDDLTRRGQIKKNRARSIPLSHIIQGTGAYIAREIVARSPRLKYSRLHMPIHDGFIFYCTRELYKEAITEAGDLMTDVANDIIPNIAMPHKIEWSKGGAYNA